MKRHFFGRVFEKAITAALCLFAAAFPVWAHHGTAVYAVDKQPVLKGTVVEWLWANPHCLLKFDVTDDKGNVTHWATEVSNPADMVKRGWSLHSFKPGDVITATVRPAKNGAPVGQILKVILPSGQTLGQHDLSQDAAPAAPGGTKP